MSLGGSKKQRWLLIGASALIIIAALNIGPRLLGQEQVTTAVADVELKISPSVSSQAEVYLPLTDWGVRFDLFDLPVLLRAEPGALNRDNLLRVADGDQVLLDESVEDIQRGVWLLALKAIIAILGSAVVLALATSALLPLSRRALLLASLGGSGLALALLALLAAVSYSPENADQPTFYGRGQELQQIIATIDREQRQAPGSYQDNFTQLLTGVSKVLSAPEPLSDDPGNSILLASDLHSNALALPALQDFTAPGQPLLFVGDFGHQGNDAEAELLTAPIAALGAPIFAVSGNHDSEQLIGSLARAGVNVLSQRGRLQPDGSWQPGLSKLQGMTLAGYDDPLLWRGEYPEDPDRTFSFGELPPLRYRQELNKLLAWWRALPEKPDILLLHQQQLAQDLAAALSADDYPRRLTIVTGHDHQPAITRWPLITIINPGSVGAGGLFGIGRERAEFAEVQFAAGQARPEIVDLIAVDPLSGQAQAERRVIANLCDNPCRFRPGGGQIARLGAGGALSP